MNAIDKINKLSKPDFISIFGNIFEKTKWIAQKSYDSKPYKNYDELFLKMIEIFDEEKIQEHAAQFDVAIYADRIKKFVEERLEKNRC